MNYYCRSNIDLDIIYKIDENNVIWTFCSRDGLGWMQSHHQGKDRIRRIKKYPVVSKGDVMLELL